MKLVITFIYLLILSGMLVFSSKRKHLLISLLSLEYSVLGMFILLFSSLDYSNLFFSLIFLTFSVCEGALGLSLLVNMSRTFGSDFFNVLNIN